MASAHPGHVGHGTVAAMPAPVAPIVLSLHTDVDMEKVSGQGDYQFQVIYTSDHLPQAANKVLVKAHGGFAVDQRPGKGESYFALPGGGIIQISGELARTRTLSTSDAMRNLNMHDTRWLGLANVLAALDTGIRTFDACLAGLGSCPFAPEATGNIVTEDFMFMLEGMGRRTGVDLEKLIAVRRVLEENLPGEPLHGAIVRAKTTKGFEFASA
jgi:hypothetical protein